jgi:uncharacterized membrane protein YoaK (UPF0700 family)
MPTGNLRQFGEALVQSLLGTGNPKSKRQVTVFALVTLSFFLGGLTGGDATNILHNRAIWIGGLFLLTALVCGLEDRPPLRKTLPPFVLALPQHSRLQRTTKM